MQKVQAKSKRPQVSRGGGVRARLLVRGADAGVAANSNENSKEVVLGELTLEPRVGATGRGLWQRY